jgi:anti-sigma factor ChrR (cupin superfamily)
MSTAINGDLSVRVAVDTAAMAWSPSPSNSVWRKRVHLVGPPEAGQVTSVVRYDPDSTFRAHDHPEGEEILVLDGVFSDEHGDWPAGTYLLNPEGFRHAPFSKKGCVLFVKLRQFPGRDRRHVVIDTNNGDWQPEAIAGVYRQLLYQQDGFADVVSMERWQPHTDPGVVTYDAGAELFVVDGSFNDDDGSFRAGHWLRFPAHSKHHPRTTDGCTLYVKRGGFAYLKRPTD